MEDLHNQTFVFVNEDHTLGNSLRHFLASHEHVEFAGYSVPHPAEPKMHLRVQSRGKTAIDCVKESAEELKKHALHLRETFEYEITQFEEQKDEER
ncbi:DNA-directed RNA polymerases I and III subunit AC19 like protein [Aduncisulcus paluster]|uniref:DNA-directed RNA polymerases I and III subunit AC19 like protein n=1 Tax=Aduncisulcus paluster TaxID=2918883 RepID=A0ABQ5K1K6_9EUKA|nr:DNA-directed RNA polymerases I and III subunit AC19 like protein [Aduncisulcus paluster]